MSTVERRIIKLALANCATKVSPSKQIAGKKMKLRGHYPPKMAQMVARGSGPAQLLSTRYDTSKVHHAADNKEGILAVREGDLNVSRCKKFDGKAWPC